MVTLAERLSLDGRAVIVTGAGRGLGRQMALALARAGADIVAAARTIAQLEETAAGVRAIGRRCLTVPTDVRDSAQVDALVGCCVRDLGRLDVMLANAGGGGAAAQVDVDAATDEQWRDTLDTNLSSAFYCARAAVRRFRTQGGGGNVILVASGTGVRGDPRNWAYAAAKGGVISLAKSLAVRLAAEGIRVNCIVPGYIARAPAEDEAEAERRRQHGRFVPVGRVGEAHELGPLAVLLASGAAPYMTGGTFVIDGGGLAAGVAPTGWVPTAGEAS